MARKKKLGRPQASKGLELGSGEQARHDLIFHVNGEKFTLENPDPRLLLVDYLRSPSVGYTGNKIGCKEGGCGACTVMLSHFDWNTRKIVHRAVDSCLMPICAIDGMAVTTTEGIGNVREQLHEVQHRVAADNGSQCGFCTPGFVMSMYSLLCSNPAPTRRQIENNFDGHLCRCTGYRAILRAMHSFACDGEKEPGPLPVFLDLNSNSPRETPAPLVPNTANQGARQPLGPGEGRTLRKNAAPNLPPELTNAPAPPAPLHFTQGGSQWFRVLKLAEVYALQKAAPRETKLVVGKTSAGIYKTHSDAPAVFVDISAIPELNEMSVAADQSGLVIGGAVTIARLMEFLERIIAERGKRGTSGLVALHEHLERVAGRQVRNVASAAGNLVMTKIHSNSDSPFPSDLFTVLTALGGSLTIGSASWPAPRRFTLPEFGTASDFPVDHVVLSIFIPFSRQDEYIRSYKVARRIQNSHAIVNAGFLVRLTDSGQVAEATLVFGGIAALPVRAVKTESFLRGKPWNEAALQGALKVLGAEIQEHMLDLPCFLSPRYRRSLAETLFYKYFVGVALQVAPGEVGHDNKSASEDLKRPVSTGQEHYVVYPDEAPVSEPIVKLTAFIQASGEAIYTPDISAPRTLYGALVLSTRAKATFQYDPAGGLDKLIELLKKKFPGVKRYLTARDISSLGTNLIGIGNDDTVFADGSVTCAGTPLGLVIAESETVAADAAAFIESECVGYMEQMPILSIEEALALPNEEGLFKDSPKSAPYLSHIRYLERPGSDQKWLKHPDQAPAGGQVVRGRQKTGDQAQFYMETQSALAVPEEGDSIIVYAATQDPDTVQRSVAAVLGISLNQVSISVNLVGGGFGGKTTRVPFVAAPAALAAWKLQRPVRVVLDRNTDMRMIGKRHPYLGKYHALFQPDGTIKGMKISRWADGGNTYDCSFFVSDESQLNGDGAYMIPTYHTEGNVCRTNKPSNNAMRSFGVIQATMIREEAIEHIAHELGMLPEDLRVKNFYKTGTEHSWDTTPYGEALKYCDLHGMWKLLMASSDFAARERAVQEFNRQNHWLKRGISMIPLKYGISYSRRMLNQARAIVNVYRGDGTALLRHGGVEIGQGIHTKMAQIAAFTLNIPLHLLRVSETDTRAVGNATSTGASTGSDLNGGAVSKACKVLRARLEKFCEEQRKTHGEQYCIDQGIAYWLEKDGWQAKARVKGSNAPTLIWINVVNLAWESRIDLTGEAFYRTPDLTQVGIKDPQGRPYLYFNYAAACTEVEIDVLTGEFSILRADLLYDAGKSLNSILDIGQIQGGFVQGIGNLMTEQLVYGRGGELLSDGTWEYKPPCSKTIPIDFRVTLLRADKYAQLPEAGLDRAIIAAVTTRGVTIDPTAIQSSRTTGEPPFVLASSAFFAIKHAILAARQDQGDNQWFELEAPATVERIQAACRVRPEHLVLRSSKGRALRAKT